MRQQLFELIDGMIGNAAKSGKRLVAPRVRDLTGQSFLIFLLR